MRQLIASRSITGNGTVTVAAKAENVYISSTVSDRIEIPMTNLGLQPWEARRKYAQASETMTDNHTLQNSRF